MALLMKELQKEEITDQIGAPVKCGLLEESLQGHI